MQVAARLQDAYDNAGAMYAESDCARAAALSRAEAAEAEMDVLRVVARAAQNVAAWKEPIQMIAPELGGSLRAIWVLEAALDALPPGSLEDGGKHG
jgi:hypothetical protein